MTSLKYFSGAGIFLILIFTVIKPGFLGEIGFWKSLLFWILQVGCLIPLLIIVQDGLHSFAKLNNLNAWIKTGITGGIASILFVPFALLLDYAFEFDDWSDIRSFPEVLLLAAHEAFALIFPVTLSWLAINAPRILQLNFELHNNENLALVKKDEASNDLFEIIPKSLGIDIVYLASELHYLRVVTTQGETLILFGLKNAIDSLMGHIDGIQTHRSYWVSKKHIEKIVGNSSKRQILTHQGYLIPISRRQYRLVKDQLSS